VRLTFGGYNEKLMEFASYVSKKLSTDVNVLLPKDDNEFDRYKDQILRALSSFDVKQPYAHASYYANIVLQPTRFQYDNKELREATSKITLPDVFAYAKRLWASGKGEALIQGNLVESDAQQMVDSITGVLSFRPIPLSEYPPRMRALPLPTSSAKAIPTCLLVSEPNPADENSVAHVMLQSLSPSTMNYGPNVS
jgi:insulysin